VRSKFSSGSDDDNKAPIVQNRDYDHSSHSKKFSQDDSNIAIRPVDSKAHASKLANVKFKKIFKPTAEDESGVQKRDYEVMMKQQTNVLIALNKSFTNRPSIKKLKAKRLRDKKETQRILKSIWLKTMKNGKVKKACDMSEEEAVTMIARYIRKRQEESK
jgi:hypothetical protein